MDGANSEFCLPILESLLRDWDKQLAASGVSARVFPNAGHKFSPAVIIEKSDGGDLSRKIICVAPMAILNQDPATPEVAP